MDVFFYLLGNLAPLYGLIALGFIGGRFVKLDPKVLADFAIFICVPIVVFGFIVQLEFKPVFILLPVIAYILQAAIALIFLRIGRKVYGDKRANLLSMCAAMGNTGYFGLPLIMLFFDAQWVAVYMFMMLGYNVFEATIGYYIAARGAFDVRGSLIKLAKFPTIYAVIAGLIANFAGFELDGQSALYWGYFKGTYIVIGMMIIGVALSYAPKLVLKFRFIGLAFLGKFVFWPVFVFALIVLDQMFTRMFGPEVYKLVMIMAIVPPAANITAFAAQLDLNPEKAATTVLLGTIFALFYIPVVLVAFEHGW